VAATNTGWKVFPHSPLQKIDEGLWRVEGTMGKSPLKRVMTIAKRADGTLVIHNGIALEENAMKEIEALGPIGYVVVPNGYHRFDAPAYKRRYPNAKFVGPAGARKRIEQAVPLDLTYPEVPIDVVVELRTLAGVKEQEGVMIVRCPSGTTLVVTDAVFNMPHVTGFPGFVLKSVTKSSGGPRVTNLFRWFVLKDKAALRADLEALAQLPELKRIIVAHHDTIESDPAKVLASVAATV
jgi:hypothetical protein